jgi:hypothetical protein
MLWAMPVVTWLGDLQAFMVFFYGCSRESPLRYRYDVILVFVFWTLFSDIGMGLFVDSTNTNMKCQAWYYGPLCDGHWLGLISQHRI